MTQSDTEAGFLGTLEVTIGEAEFTTGSFSPQIVGIAINDNTEAISGPVGISAACFGGPNLLAVETGFTEGDEIPVGGFSPFSMDLFDIEACAAFAIAGSGYNF